MVEHPAQLPSVPTHQGGEPRCVSLGLRGVLRGRARAQELRAQHRHQVSDTSAESGSSPPV